MWQGSLAKQAIRLCGVLCLEAAGGARERGLAPEPRLWPEQLQVNYRISVHDALEHFASAAAPTRAVRVLVPQDAAAGDEQQLRAFIDYLNAKDRAGMVRLPAQPQAGLGPRAMYLIVPRPPVCHTLQVAWDGQCVMLIAVVVPQPSAGASGGGGGSHHQNAGQQQQQQQAPRGYQQYGGGQQQQQPGMMPPHLGQRMR